MNRLKFLGYTFTSFIIFTGCVSAAPINVITKEFPLEASPKLIFPNTDWYYFLSPNQKFYLGTSDDFPFNNPEILFHYFPEGDKPITIPVSCSPGNISQGGNIVVTYEYGNFTCKVEQ